MLSAGELYSKCREAFSSYGMVCEPIASDFEMLESSAPALAELDTYTLEIIQHNIQEIVYLLASVNVDNICILDFSFIREPAYFSALAEMFTLCLTGGELNDICFGGLEIVCKNHNDLENDEQRSLDLLNKLMLKCVIDGEFVKAKVLAENVVDQYMLYASKRAVV